MGWISFRRKSKELTYLRAKRAGLERKEIKLELERGACLLDRPTFLCLTGLVRLTGPGHC